MSKNKQLNINNLNYSYHNKTVFNNLNLQIDENKINVILGPSGSGKTTFLNIIANTINNYSGDIEDFNNLKKSYIFQEPRIIPWLTVKENLIFILKEIYNQKRAEEIAIKYLKMVGLENELDNYPKNLSGGMLQRVSIARAFSYPSDILLLDEAFKSLDLEIKIKIIEDFIKILKNQNKTIILVTHDILTTLLLSQKIFLFKGSPSNIEDIIINDLPLENRDLNSDEIKQIEKKLYNFFKVI